MAKYKTYPEYKDSGVEWLGEIPEHWGMTTLKYIAELTPKKPALSRDNFFMACSFIPMEKLKLNTLILNEEKTINQVYDGYTYFEDDDILIAKVTPCFENKNMAIAKKLKNKMGFGSSEIYVLRCNSKVNNKFLFYRLQEDGFMAVAIAAMTGAGGLKRVPSETLNSYIVALPNILEQAKISDFLDLETAKIDNLIDKQQQLIELLKEKRQAVISHAVTKGLNPDVPMKDSGVEWLEEVPAHWNICKLKYLARICNGQDYKNVQSEYGYPVIGSGGQFSYAIDYMYRKPSVLLGRKGTIDKPIYIDTPFWVVDTMYYTDISSTSTPKYFYFLALTIQFNLLATNTALPSMTQDSLGNYLFSLPLNQNEQQEIVHFLEQTINKVDCLIEKQHQQIELLQERCTALISAAVTGKIDVRNWRAPTDQRQAEAIAEAMV